MIILPMTRTCQLCRYADVKHMCSYLPELPELGEAGPGKAGPRFILSVTLMHLLYM